MLPSRTSDVVSCKLMTITLNVFMHVMTHVMLDSPNKFGVINVLGNYHLGLVLLTLDRHLSHKNLYLKFKKAFQDWFIPSLSRNVLYASFNSSLSISPWGAINSKSPHSYFLVFQINAVCKLLPSFLRFLSDLCEV